MTMSQNNSPNVTPNEISKTTNFLKPDAKFLGLSQAITPQTKKTDGNMLLPSGSNDRITTGEKMNNMIKVSAFEDESPTPMK